MTENRRQLCILGVSQVPALLVMEPNVIKTKPYITRLLRARDGRTSGDGEGRPVPHPWAHCLPQALATSPEAVMAHGADTGEDTKESECPVPAWVTSPDARLVRIKLGALERDREELLERHGHGGAGGQ